MVSDNNWSCIYRASRDGFKASAFHDKCDYKPHTLILIRTEYDRIFGCFTEQSWDSDENNNGECLFVKKEDPNAFIFSLLNDENEPLYE